MQKNKKIIISIVSIFLLILLSLFLYMIINKKPKNDEPIFKISKIMLYSSADITDNSQEGLLKDLDIHQFTDIAIYIDNTSYTQDLTSKNTVKELSISNIKIDTASDVGEKAIAYKNPLLYGKFKNLSPNVEEINFNIITTNEENTTADYNSPVFFADCSNPISIRIFKLRITNKL